MRQLTFPEAQAQTRAPGVAVVVRVGCDLAGEDLTADDVDAVIRPFNLSLELCRAPSYVFEPRQALRRKARNDAADTAD